MRALRLNINFLRVVSKNLGINKEKHFNAYRFGNNQGITLYKVYLVVFI